MSIKRLRLKVEERDEIIKASAEAFLEDPRVGIWGAIERGFKALPTDRRPTLTKARTWKWLVPSVQTMIAQLKALQDATAEQPPPDLTTIPTEALLQELADRFVSDALDKLRPIVQEGIREDLRRIVAEPAVRPQKKKVAIIGLLKRQEQIIRREFSNEFDLRFHKVKDKQSPSNGLLGTIKDADHVFGMVNFMGHSTEDSIQRVARHYVRVPGGMTALKDKLTELYVQ